MKSATLFVRFTAPAVGIAGALAAIALSGLQGQANYGNTGSQASACPCGFKFSHGMKGWLLSRTRQPAPLH